MVACGALNAVRFSGLWLKRASRLHCFARDGYSLRNSDYQLKSFQQINGADLLQVRGPVGAPGLQHPGPSPVCRVPLPGLSPVGPVSFVTATRPDGHWGNHRMVIELGIASYRSTDWDTRMAGMERPALVPYRGGIGFVAISLSGRAGIGPIPRA